MNLPKLAVDTKQMIIEGALTNAWLERFGVEQTRDSADIDVKKLAEGGADVRALAKVAKERGHPGKVTFALVQTFPDGKAIAQIGAAKRKDVEDADAAARGSAVVAGITGSLERATTALERAAQDIEAVAKDCAKISFDEFLARLGPESTVMSAIKLVRAAKKQFGALHGKSGSQALWASTQAQRDAVWPAAAKLFTEYQKLFASLAEIGEAASSMDMGEAVLRSQAVATVAGVLNPSIAEIAETAVYFRSADEVAAEANAMRKAQSRGPDRVIEGRKAFAEEYCAAKGWPLDPAQLSMDQIMEIRAQEGWINAGRPNADSTQ
jgi:hypothetical protein